jgi:hypothetical protein
MCAGEGKKRTSKLFETKSTLNFKKKMIKGTKTARKNGNCKPHSRVEFYIKPKGHTVCIY